MFASSSRPKITEELRRRLDASDQQAIPRPRACDIEQVPLGVVDLLQVGIVTDSYAALLQTDTRE